MAPLPALLLVAVQSLSPQGGAAAEDELARLLASAGAALEADDLDEAERGFAQAAREAPDSPFPRIGLCEVEARRERLIEALEHCRKARELAPRAPLPALRIGQLLAAIGAKSEALTAMAEARELDPSLASAYLVPALLLREAGRPDEAIPLLEEGLARAAPQPQLAEELCFLLITQGHLDRVGEVARQALETWPDRPGLKLALGMALSEQADQRERAVELLSEALEEDVPRPGHVHFALGRILIDLDRHEEAIAHLRQAQSLEPDDPAIYYQLGLALRGVRDTEGAREALARFQELTRSRGAEESSSEGLSAAINEAHQLARQDRLFAALQRLDAVLSDHPDEPRAHALRAKVLGTLGRDGEALEAARRARALAPELAENHYVEGRLLVRSGELAGGEARLQRALALDPTLARAHELLGILADNAGRDAEAAEHLGMAFEHGIDTPALRQRLARALARAGRTDEARAVLEAPRKARP